MPVTAADQQSEIEAISGIATHYGYSYHGQRMGCGGDRYDSYDPTIVAVSPARYAEWPCGTESGSIAVCGGQPHTCRVEIRVR